LHEFLLFLTLSFWKFWVPSRNRLAGMKVPPGGTSVIAILGFVTMSCLAVSMNRQVMCGTVVVFIVFC